MFSILAGLLYLAAILIPLSLLRRFGPTAWFIHALAIAAALGVGLAPATPLLNTLPGTLVYGATFTFLMVWGVAGLFTRRKPKSAHATA